VGAPPGRERLKALSPAEIRFVSRYRVESSKLKRPPHLLRPQGRANKDSR